MRLEFRVYGLLLQLFCIKADKTLAQMKGKFYDGKEALQIKNR